MMAALLFPACNAAAVINIKLAVVTTLGANPTPMPWPIYTELEQGGHRQNNP